MRNVPYNVIQPRKNQNLSRKRSPVEEKDGLVEFVWGWGEMWSGVGEGGSVREFMRERRKFVFVVNNIFLLKIRRLLLLLLLLLLLSRFTCVWLCATPETAAHQAPPSLGFSGQEHWSGLPFPSPMHESEKWKWSRSVVPDSQRPHGLQPTRLLHPWDFPGKSTGVGCH